MTVERLRASLAERYALESELGQGGMATVYLARDLKHDRQVALKVLRPELAAILGRERFLSEVRLTARLDHPHILTLLDSGETDGYLWYTLPYIRGESLRHKLDRETQLGVDEAVSITRQIAGALEHAHQHGIIHRDVKPENILLHEGEAMLADFGIALAVKEAGGQRLTETGLSLGTPQYMSPEQATAERQLDARSDVYSLGAVLYEMLAGEPPFTGATGQAVIAKLLVERPSSLRTVRDTVPPGLEAVVARALAKVPADRFPSAAAFAAALVAPDAHRPPKPPPKRALLLGGAAVLLLALAGVWLAPRLRSGRGSAARGEPALRQATFAGNAYGPALSPDGKMLAYGALTCPTPKQCTTAVIVEDLSLGQRRTLADGFSGRVFRLRWSPDQRFLLVHGTRGTAEGSYLLSWLSSREQFLGEVYQGQFLGSTDTIVAVRQSAYMQDGNVRGATRWYPLLTRDGVVRDSIPFVVPGTSPYPIPSPDGRRILVWALNNLNEVQGFYLIDRRGRLTDSLPVPFGADGQMVEWTASGDGVVMLARADTVDSDLWTLLRFPVTTEGKVRLPPDTITARLRLPGSPSVEPDHLGGAPSVLSPPLPNGELAIGVQTETYGLSTFERPSLAALPARKATIITGAAGGLGATISPDGERILVRRRMLLDGRPAYQPEVWPFEGGAGTPLGPPRRGTRGWAWSEDGASVYGLAAATAPGQLEYSRIDVASGRVLQSRTVPDSLFWLLQGSLLLDLPRSQSSPWEGRAYPQGGTAPLVFSLPEPGRIVFTLTTRPDGQGSWLMYLIGAPAGFKASLNDTAYTIHVARPGLPAVRLLDLNGPWGAPGLLHLAPGPVFELRVERHDGSKHRLLAEPGRSPRDLGPMPVSLPWPTSFSADGRRGVLVEAESPRTDIWLLRWPGADSAGAGGKR